MFIQQEDHSHVLLPYSKRKDAGSPHRSRPHSAQKKLISQLRKTADKLHKEGEEQGQHRSGTLKLAQPDLPHEVYV